jgi:hypothetical protein
LPAFTEVVHISHKTANDVAVLNKWVKCIVDCASTLERRLTNQEDLLTAKCVELRLATEAGSFDKKPSKMLDEDHKQSLLLDVIKTNPNEVDSDDKPQFNEKSVNMEFA